MSFDVPKVVQSPGCDHGHNEDSRNSRDIKIDILDDYIRTPEVLRTFSEKTRVPEGYRNPPGGIWALLGLSGKEGKGAREGPSPQAQSELGGGPAAPFLPPSFLFLPSPSPNRKRRSPTPSWSRIPPLGAPPPLGRPSPPLLYIRRRGAPHRHNN